MSGEAVTPRLETPVVDAHTHAFSPTVFAERERLVAADHWFGMLYADPRAKLAAPADTLASMDAAGIGVSILCGFPWSDSGRCRDENAYLAGACAASGGRLAWLGMVVPGSPDAAADADWCLRHGASGIGELNADAQRLDLRDPRPWQALGEVVRAHARPLMFHASEPVGHDYPGKGVATPERLLAMLASIPDVDVALAHFGGGLPFYELMPEVQALTRRVVYDSGATTYLYRFEVFPRVVDLVGAERVLFGSDFPVLGQERFLRRTRAALRDADEAIAVLAANARRFYRLPGDGEGTR